MKKVLLIASLVLAANAIGTLAGAQETLVSPAEYIQPLPNFACLRGISYFHIEVNSPEQKSLAESELRVELRDMVELELRRANLQMRTISPTEPPQSAVPLLQINLKYDRAMGRIGNCELEICVKDRVNIIRNNQVITTTTFEMRVPITSVSEQTFARETKNCARKAVQDIIKGIKKNEK